MNNSSACLITGFLLSSLIFVGDGGNRGSGRTGGTFAPSEAQKSWEVLVGSAVTDLNTPIKTIVSNVDIPVNKEITVLSIRA